MSAERTAWWRRWAGLPVVVALLFAGAVVGANPRASQLVPAPSVLQAVVMAPAPSLGQRPDLQTVDRGGHGHSTPDPTGSAWLAQRAVTSTIVWWHLRRDNDGHRAQTGREVYQGRGPPGRRAADALS
ncbi:hypothetical protein M1L60_37320 [Actinoplanes sp. TRM 88003]|uniref:Uncharacterized protein n=1 Tax=Paractinoplanes aksuensis TaxID=2939490 RepID=A0ABT1DZR3_9ACTN|nr:hypothetical protein [Actinoplanes aksuensis]MCO8276255.1 hypothetical protein [Actinoplanes aksuensis]